MLQYSAQPTSTEIINALILIIREIDNNQGNIDITVFTYDVWIPQAFKFVSLISTFSVTFDLFSFHASFTFLLEVMSIPSHNG